MIHVSNKIRDLRLGLGLTLRELGERAGVAFGDLCDIENGKGNPSEAHLDLIAHALGVDSLRDLMEKDEHDFAGGEHGQEEETEKKEGRRSW